MKIKNKSRTEEEFHDRWAKSINIDDLAVYQAFEGPVSPEYRFAIKLLGNIENKKILNPGCGAGEETVYLANKGAKVWAVDISQGMLDVVNILTNKFKVNKLVHTRKINLEKRFEFETPFDLIFGNSVLHHVDLNKALPNLSRVLKKGGKVVFIEPLTYNPLINIYRKMAHLVRTPDEHPFTRSDVFLFKKYFKNVKHYEFHFLTLLIFCSFFIFEGVSPNKDRYWKKIIREGYKYKKIFNFLYSIDKLVFSLFPFLKWFSWVTVIKAIKE